MNIIEFVEHVIGDKSLSPAQRMALKAVYGLPLTPEELDLWTQAAGGRLYVPGVEQSEIDIQKGRKAGGTDKILTNMMLYEVCTRPPKLAVGERAVAMIVTSELKRQSRVAYDYCLGKMEHSPILRKLIRRTTQSEIELTNGCSILIFPCNEGRVRAPSILFFGGDEVCFWKTEGRSIDISVLNAARPGLIFPTSKMVKLSSVSWMRGEMYQDDKRYFGIDDAPVLVLKGSTEFFFPGFSKVKLAKAKLRDPVAYEAEHMCKFKADLSGMYDPAVIDRAVNPDRPLELPFRSTQGWRAAFVDVAGGGGRDSYAIAIGRLEGERVIVEVVRSRAPKYNPETVTEDYAALLKSWNVFEVTGDKFSGDFASSLYAKHGINYRRAEKTKSELYVEAEGAFNAGLAEIPQKEPLVSQLKSLVRKARSGGRDSVDTDGGAPEDEANVVAGLIEILRERTRGSEVRIWRVGSGPSVIEQKSELEVTAGSLLGLADSELERRLDGLSIEELEEIKTALERQL